MVSPKRTVRLLQQLAQSGGGYAVVGLLANGQIWTLLALILAEPAGEVNRRA
jgi:hypothetical protein